MGGVAKFKAEATSPRLKSLAAAFDAAASWGDSYFQQLSPMQGLLRRLRPFAAETIGNVLRLNGSPQISQRLGGQSINAKFCGSGREFRGLAPPSPFIKLDLGRLPFTLEANIGLCTRIPNPRFITFSITALF